MAQFRKILGLSIIILYSLSSSSFDTLQHNRLLKMKALLTSQKWTVVEVKKNKLSKAEKMNGFQIEVGNVLSFSIDGKFGFKNNDYKYKAGQWVLNDKELVLVHDALSTESRIESSIFKLVKAKEGHLLLKRLSTPKGKILLK